MSHLQYGGYGLTKTAFNVQQAGKKTIIMSKGIKMQIYDEKKLTEVEVHKEENEQWAGPGPDDRYRERTPPKEIPKS